MKTIGITTTVPTEVLLAAGCQPIDLNNVFISDPNPERLVTKAERAGFPINCCTWIKGIYGTVMERGIDSVICVTNGDCSNTQMLMEVLKLKGVNAIPFAYPDSPNLLHMQACLESLAKTLGATVDEAEKVRLELERARSLARELDELTWKNNVASGFENHYWHVSASDFAGDAGEYEKGLNRLLSECRSRNPYGDDMIRLAYIGVPSVFGRDLYRFLERNGAHVVFNEIQRQFAMPHRCNSLAEQYSRYTYPYSLSHRIDDILAEIKERRIDGVIHYVQAFCHRGIGDIVLRERIKLPMLTVEGNNEYNLTQHLKTRLEAFLDVVKNHRDKNRSRGEPMCLPSNGDTGS
ncbi:MAG: 2-hydroxyacyl-CoA dehydratase [Dehalococcoidia bacterium]|jgi:benzoyl-CoA reductase/2-hydroxyglutaryl-CoA dehydratase subunit BcrC/BadD/HgdB